VARPVVRRSVVEMGTIICCLRIAMGIGFRFMRGVDGGEIEHGAVDHGLLGMMSLRGTVDSGQGGCC
jgi:hypothetical protein